MFLDEKLLNEETEIKNEEETYCEGSDALFEIALESEMSWNNIVNETIMTEATALVAMGKNDKDTAQSKMNDAKTGFFKKVIDWAVDKLKKLGEFFKKVIDKLASLMPTIDNFIKKYASSVASFKGIVNVEGYEWKVKNFSAVLANMAKGISREAMTTDGANVKSVDALCATTKIGGSTYKEFKTKLINNIRGKKVTSFSAPEVAARLNYLKSSKGEIKAVQMVRSHSEATIKAVMNTAKKGQSMAKGAGDKAQVEKYHNIIQTLKNASTLNDAISAILVSQINAKVSECVKIVKATAKGKATTGNSSEVSIVK